MKKFAMLVCEFWGLQAASVPLVVLRFGGFLHFDFMITPHLHCSGVSCSSFRLLNGSLILIARFMIVADIDAGFGGRCLVGCHST